MKSKKTEPIFDPEKDKEEVLQEKVRQMMDTKIPDVVATDKDVPSTELPSNNLSPDELQAAIEASVEPVKPTAPTLSKKIAVSHFQENTTEKADESALVSVDAKKEEDLPTEAELHASFKEEAQTEPKIQEEAKPTEPDPETQAPMPSDDEKNPADEVFDTPETNTAVDEIIAEESDTVLAVADGEVTHEKAEKPVKQNRIKRLLHAWWHNKIARFATIGLILIGAGAAIAVPTSRYALLNALGVRSKASVKIIDASTQQPLENVSIELGGKLQKTDDNGLATFTEMKQGSMEMKISRRAFAPVTKRVVLGWGSNELNDESITPVGVQYRFVVTDFLSAKPLANAEAVSGEYSAKVDEKGLITLTIDAAETKDLDVVITASDYRSETIVLTGDSPDEQTLKMAAARKHIFVSKRSGKYDIYQIDADGKNEKMILAGTGNEREDLTLLPHPNKDVVALVSTRENVRNKDGYLLSNLNIVDLATAEPVKISQSERVQLIDWVGDKIIYLEIAAGSSGTSPGRYRLFSYDIASQKKTELATSNYFNDVLAVDGHVYFAESSAYKTTQVGLVRVSPDGSNPQTILSQEVWSMVRTDADNLTVAIQNGWYRYNFRTKNLLKLNGEPANMRSRHYQDSPDGSKSLWVDTRDGKGVLLAYETATKADKELKSESGLNYPVRWLSGTTVIYRISNANQTADYVLSLDGGDPVKIRDVTATNGTDSWYYY